MSDYDDYKIDNFFQDMEEFYGEMSVPVKDRIRIFVIDSGIRGDSLYQWYLDITGTFERTHVNKQPDASTMMRMYTGHQRYVGGLREKTASIPLKELIKIIHAIRKKPSSEWNNGDVFMLGEWGDIHYEYTTAIEFGWSVERALEYAEEIKNNLLARKPFTPLIVREGKRNETNISGFDQVFKDSVQRQELAQKDGGLRKKE